MDVLFILVLIALSGVSMWLVRAVARLRGDA